MKRPRLRTILLLVNLVLIVLPLSGIWTLQIYESALLRQTESELIAQGAVVAAAFRTAWLGAAPPGALQLMPAATAEQPAPPVEGEAAWRPRAAELDLAEDPVLPPPPNGEPAAAPPEPAAAAAGAALQPVLREVQLTTLAGIRLVDSNGIVVATTREEAGLSLQAREEVAAALRGESISLLRERGFDGSERPGLESISRGSSLRVFVGLPVIEQGRVLGAVVLSRTPRSIIEALYGKRYHLAALAAVLIGSVVLLAFFTAITISRPLRAVMLQARRVARGESRSIEPLRHPVTREVADLSASLATMAQTLERRADYIAGFAAEVSHEFKTPLTAIRGTVELLRDHLAGMSPAERTRFLGNIEQDVGRLDRLVRRLLELARADTLRPRSEETACVDAVVGRLAEQCGRLGLPVALQGEARPVHVGMAADLLEEALRNLTDNVRQHAGPGATATIAWRDDGTRVAIRVADDGIGISAGNAPRIFDRFFTTARDTGGTGLGLAIARSQLAAHGGAIAQVPAERGAAFEITLPAADRTFDLREKPSPEGRG